MSGMVKNFVARVSVSAVVGAIVAGGIVWFTQDSVSRYIGTSVKDDSAAITAAVADVSAQNNELLATQASLVETIDALEARIAELEEANTNLGDEVEALAKIAMEDMDAPEDASMETALSELKSDISALADTISALEARIEATPAPAEAPDFDTILDKMIGAVERLESATNAGGSE